MANTPKRVPSTKLKNNMGEWFDYILFHKEIIITRSGRIVAKLIRYTDRDYLDDIERITNGKKEN